MHSDSEDSFSDTPQDKFRSNHNRGIPVTDKDIDALAKWIVSEPRRRYPSAKLYFTAFQNQVCQTGFSVLSLVDRDTFSGMEAQELQMGGIK